MMHQFTLLDENNTEHKVLPVYQDIVFSIYGQPPEQDESPSTWNLLDANGVFTTTLETQSFTLDVATLSFGGAGVEIYAKDKVRHDKYNIENHIFHSGTKNYITFKKPTDFDSLILSSVYSKSISLSGNNTAVIFKLNNPTPATKILLEVSIFNNEC
jgi:hypothetical protein